MILKNIKIISVFTLILIGLLSCNKEEINEPAGLSEYRIQNQSDKVLIFKSNPETIIQPNEIKKIGSDGDIGILAPLPSDGLGSFKLYRDNNGTEIIAIERNPINNTEWIEEKQDNEEYGLVYYTMKITDSMIN